MRKTALAAVLATVGVVGAASLADASPQARDAAAKRVGVDDNFFSPRSASVRRRGVVTWVWRGSQEHNVFFTRAPRGARKPRRCRIQESGTCSRRMPRARGRYSYVCTLHGGMTGSIRVR